MTGSASRTGETLPFEVPLHGMGKSTSRIGFGTGGLLRIGSARQRQCVLAAALSAGITHFDTAPIYGLGESERALGLFLRRQRHSVTVTTKFGLRPAALAAQLAVFQRFARRGLQLFPSLRRVAVRHSAALYTPPSFSRAAILASLEDSLRALRTDYVDFFLAHQASAEALPDEDVVELLEELRRAGKIRAFGVATDYPRLAPVLRRRPELSSVVQFDNELTSGNMAGMERSTARMERGTECLLITYGFIARGVSVCREQLQAASAAVEDLRRLDDQALGGLLLRAAALANPDGIVLMQSRSIARIASNTQAVHSDRCDDQVRRLVEFLGPKR